MKLSFTCFAVFVSLQAFAESTKKGFALLTPIENKENVQACFVVSESPSQFINDIKEACFNICSSSDTRQSQSKGGAITKVKPGNENSICYKSYFISAPVKRASELIEKTSRLNDILKKSGKEAHPIHTGGVYFDVDSLYQCKCFKNWY